MMKHQISFAGALLAVSALCLTNARADDMKMKMDAKTVAPLKMALNNNLDKLFMLHAAEGNMAEVMMGKLALQKTRNPDVKMLAQTIIKGHSMAQRDLLPHFKALGMMAPTKLGPANMAVYEKLKTLKGAAFDKAYIGGQVSAHEATIVLFEHEIDAGKVQVAKMHAMNKLPGILGHTAMLYDTAVKINAPGAALRPAPVKDAAKEVCKDMMDMKMDHDMSKM